MNYINYYYIKIVSINELYKLLYKNYYYIRIIIII